MNGEICLNNKQKLNFPAFSVYMAGRLGGLIGF
jgi:hypothetical protein